MLVTETGVFPSLLPYQVFYGCVNGSGNRNEGEQQGENGKFDSNPLIKFYSSINA